MPPRPAHNFALYHMNDLLTTLSNRPVEPYRNRSSDLYFPVAAGEQAAAADVGAPAGNCAAVQMKLTFELQRIPRRGPALDREPGGAGGVKRGYNVHIL